MMFFFINSFISADTLKLKSGRVIKGKVVSEDNRTVYFVVGGSEMGFPREQVESIEKESDSESEIKIAEDFYLNKNFKMALEKYRQIKKTNPDAPDIDVRIAECLKEYFKEVTEPADKLLEKKEYQKAIDIYEKFVAGDFKDTFFEDILRVKLSEAYTSIALYYADRIMLESASRTIRKAVEYNPASSNAHLVLGQLELKSGRRATALREFELAVAADKANENANKYLALVQERMSAIEIDTEKPEKEFVAPQLTLASLSDDKYEQEARRFAELRTHRPPDVDKAPFNISNEKGRLILFLASYNAGHGIVMSYNYKVPPYRETREYIKRVMLFMDSPLDKTPYDDLIEQKAKKYNLNPKLIKSIAKAESDFNPKDVTKNYCGGARGLMQIIPEVWRDTMMRTGNKWKYDKDVFDPEKNLEVACNYLRWLDDNYVSKWEFDTNNLYVPAFIG